MNITITEEQLQYAAEIIIRHDVGSISCIQRYCKTGYNTAYKTMQLLERNGVVGPDRGVKPREILLSKEDLKQMDFLTEEDLD